LWSAAWIGGCENRCDKYDRLYEQCAANAGGTADLWQLKDPGGECDRDGPDALDCWNDVLEEHDCHDSGDLSNMLTELDECEPTE
jgi:hypothetical protein